MEVNEYINSPLVGSEISTLSSSMNVKALEKIDSTVLVNNSFSLDIETVTKRSNLNISLQDIITNIISDQQSVKNLNQQSDILFSLQNISTQMLASNQNSALLSFDDYQPSIEELLSKYNYLSTNLNKNFEKYQEETNSRNYFDGMLGSKPLNPSEILEAVEKQMEFVKLSKSFFMNNIEKLENKALEVINIEIDKSNKEAPFKNIDFGKNMANFTSANINSIVGSVALSQANAIPAHSPKLLS